MVKLINTTNEIEYLIYKQALTQYFFFFFQAEDGIRDYKVTGVQTCALPISSLQFTITNPSANTTAANGVAFTDTLPTGLTVANSSSTVCGGTLTTTAPTGIEIGRASCRERV